jgi:hypothetical protein
MEELSAAVRVLRSSIHFTAKLTDTPDNTLANADDDLFPILI